MRYLDNEGKQQADMEQSTTTMTKSIDGFLSRALYLSWIEWWHDNSKEMKTKPKKS